jgi:hypothetical protein
MSFFTCILILICIYCPWIVPLAFILILLAWLYHTSVILFWIIVGAFVGMCIYAVCSTK